MYAYTIKGVIKDRQNKPIENVMIQAMESDQMWYEDHNDDLIDSKWVNRDGTFEISFDKESFKDTVFERNPDLYLIIRNSFGQIIYQTEIRRGVDSSDSKSLFFDIVLDSTEKKITPPFSTDPYLSNNERVIEAFQRVGDTSEFQLNDISRIFRLLITSINAWSLYTTDYMWNVIGYDGPQVPRYPWREQGHSHKLSWENKEQKKND
jgi:hypothetical protein